MSKKILVAAVAALALGATAQAQTNLQTFYDFGKNRNHFTTTLEGFYNDNWGNTFFFIDYDYNAKNDKGVNQAPSGSYMEIARCLNFWQDTPLSMLFQGALQDFQQWRHQRFPPAVHLRMGHAGPVRREGSPLQRLRRYLG